KRKQAFFLVLAGHTFQRATCKKLALRCYSLVLRHCTTTSSGASGYQLDTLLNNEDFLHHQVIMDKNKAGDNYSTRKNNKSGAPAYGSRNYVPASASAMKLMSSWSRTADHCHFTMA
ncbi:unnamed protein product, partial [Amoebophrya sp. A120]